MKYRTDKEITRLWENYFARDSASDTDSDNANDPSTKLTGKKLSKDVMPCYYLKSSIKITGLKELL